MEEMLEIVNESGFFTGEQVSRKTAHKDGILHAASHVFIYKFVDNKIYILLQRRSSTKDSFPNCLDISSAGHCSAGEDYDSTALKELEEELGLKIDIDALKFAFYQKINNVDEFYGEKFIDNEVNKVYILKQDIDVNEIKLQKEEISEVVWMDTSNIQKELKNNNPEYCIPLKEFKQVVEVINVIESKLLKRQTINEFKNKYFFLSNFYPCEITHDGLTYKSTEAAFQAAKCQNINDKIAFTQMTASESKKTGRQVKNIRSDWDDVRIAIMKEIVLQKFTQNKDLKYMLLETADSILVEGNTWNDKYWGVCNGEGENHLGIILEEVRSILSGECFKIKK